MTRDAPASVPAIDAIDAIERAVAGLDPDLLAAAREVDISLVRWSLGLTPLERHQVCTRNTRALANLRDAAGHR